ncbi:MAG: TetR/AcrR family transcriptional regulator [Opitutales bacterium]
MARPRQFDETFAVNEALELFWEKGFASTSLQELLERMQLSRQSFYNAFGSKEGVTVAALKLFRERFNERLAALFEPDAGVEAISGFLDYYLITVAPLPERRSCLMTRATVELGRQDEAAAVLIEEHFMRLGLAFETALAQACARGELDAQVDVKGTAALLVALTQGIGVMARAGTPNRELRRAVRTAFDFIGEVEPLASRVKS